MRAVIAGSGPLPALFARALQQKYQQPVFVLGITGNWQREDFDGFPSDEVDLGHLGAGVEILQKNQCDELIFVGKIQRDAVHHLSLDDFTRALFAKTVGKGDDYAVRALHNSLRECGFAIAAPQEILPELVCERIGTLGMTAPDEAQMQDIKRGQEILRILSPADVGQAIVIHQGLVLGIEAIEGTDVLIARTAGYQIGEAGAVLVKLPKIGQTHLIDLPAIGLETVQCAIDCGFAGIAMQTRGCLFINGDEAVRLADRHQFFIHALDENHGRNS